MDRSVIGYPRFTERQQTVIQLLCEGHNRKMIAQRMNISEYGVKAHLKLIYKKLDVSTSVDAVVKIKELNLVPNRQK
jgi:DNA-binding NarL/FixJ family response regulator